MEKSKNLESLFSDVLKELISPDYEKDAGLRDTPKRMVRMYEELLSGLKVRDFDITVFPNSEEYNQLVIQKNISCCSLCEHHFLPFIGKVHIGYLPLEYYVGLSKLARVVDYFSKRPQVQERLTMQIADFLYDKIKPKGIIVVIEAEHQCMTIRGVKKIGAVTVTSAIKGELAGDTREEFLRLLKL